MNLIPNYYIILPLAHYYVPVFCPCCWMAVTTLLVYFDFVLCVCAV